MVPHNGDGRGRQVSVCGNRGVQTGSEFNFRISIGSGGGRERRWRDRSHFTLHSDDAHNCVDLSVAPTPTVFPAIGINGVQNSVCSAAGLNPPTSSVPLCRGWSGNKVVWEFAVDHVDRCVIGAIRV